MKDLLTVDALYYCVQGVRDISGSNGRPEKTRTACDKFLKAYEAGTVTGHEMIPVAGIQVGQFFTEASLTKENIKETLDSAMNLAKKGDFKVEEFSMKLKLATAMGEMAVEMNRQNGGAEE